MDLLPFGNLPPYRPRRFVPDGLDADDSAQVETLFDQLEQRLRAAANARELEATLVDWSELTSVLDEDGNRRYIAMTCHTDNEEAERAYLQFVEQVEPRLKPRQFRLAQAFVLHPCLESLPPERYAVLRRDLQTQVDLFRPENIPLETEEARLGQQYQKLIGSLTVQFQGKEQTLVQMGRYLEETDRAVRQESWELAAKRRLQEKAALEHTFDRLVQLRQAIASNAGFANYRDYAFRKMCRFDYSPGDCERFHEALEMEVIPLVKELQARRQRHLGLDRVRPWDLNVDPLNRPPLRPFQAVSEMVAHTQQIFNRLDPELGEGFQKMQDLRLLDLDNRKGKGPGGYQSTLAESRLPFIFMNAVGIQRDVETIFHEAGHAFHALASQEEDLHAYRNPPIEICEVASMSMELLANEFLEEFYTSDEVQRARQTHLESIIGILPWIATVDAFQHWIYTHAGHTAEERTAAWNRLMDRFGGLVDWSGYGEARSFRWHAQLHIFLYPFYYIEYGIAQLGALQVWANSMQDKAGALRQYKQALRLGGSRPLPELFAAAGCQLKLDRETLRPLMQLIGRQVQRLQPA